MKNLIEYLLIHLVDHPEAVEIEESQPEEQTGRRPQVVYTIRVHDEDVGRVIGKGGSTIHAIRTIVKIRAVKEGVHAMVSLANE
jgi:predicted RNA-binding protein YlqC (UPF0109 family)